ncbi:hypothetical protein QFC19_008308 [Naganishia cerealis]|uniref:Uncharacterized protein n=1 Tax=Naganishia cerealis TaxID=610337 RepID=A0ACC2V2K7_9TREE|nr:hypothetical protein QFC19_008308 [Naganishia cerealis]
MSSIEKSHLVVIGAGVIGLTTALLALESGKYDVTIVARDLPGDKKCIGFTSPWAGAHHFRYITKAELPAGISQGCMFDTVTIDTSKYLPCLVAEVRRLGGNLIRYNLTHVSQLQPPIVPREADAIVVAAGLGARHLGGVEDHNCYPIRGQVVLVKAPWYKRGVTKSSKTGDWTYTIPRASGDVILGGFKTDNDWTAHAIASQTTDILERCIAMAPDLVPVSSCKNRDPQVLVKELRKLIIEEGAGLRPARKGGVRIESEDLLVGNGKKVIPLIHHYGHSGAGYQASFGSARLCMEEVAKCISSKNAKRQATKRRAKL